MNVIRRLAPLALLALATQPAGADEHRRHGSTCGPKHGSQTLIAADERGSFNASTTTPATVTCASPDRQTHAYNEWWAGPNGEKTAARSNWAVTPTIMGITVRGRDLSASSPFSCYLFRTAENGFSSWGPTKYACSVSGGCPDLTSEYTGMVSFSWSASQLGEVLDNDYVGVVCTLPPSTNLGASYVKGFILEDSAYVDTWSWSEDGVQRDEYQFVWW